MSRISPQVKVGGSPALALEETGASDQSSRWRAWMAGRSCGGYLVGYGPNPEAAIDALEADVKRYLESVRHGRSEWRRITANGRTDR